MATYLFKCRNCGTPFTANTREPDIPFCCDEPALRRDYRAESVGFSVAVLKRERNHGSDSDLRDMFLETAEEAATPDDPDGSKAIAEWNERHEPRDVSESKALRPKMPLHSKKYL